MLAHSHTVQPRRRAPVRCADDEKDAPASPAVRNDQRALIPADVRTVGHAGERCAPRERHEDRLRRRQRALEPSRSLALVRRIELELPTAVQVDPRSALKVGSRVFGKWDGDGERLRICCAGREQREGGAEKSRSHGHAIAITRCIEVSSRRSEHSERVSGSTLAAIEAGPKREMVDPDTRVAPAG